MKLNYNLFALLFVCIIAIEGCKSTKQKVCNIDMLLCTSPTEGKLPEDAYSILLPFTDLGKEIILPQGDVFNANGKVSYIKPKTWLERIRGNITKNTTLTILNEKIKNHLNSLDVSSLNITTSVDDDFIDKSSKSYDAVLVFTTSKNGSGDDKCFNKIEELNKYIADTIMSENPSSKILVVFGKQRNGNAGTDNSVIVDPTNCSDKFCAEVHQKLMEIARCEKGKEKVYEERFALAKAFCEQYLDANTKLGQYTGEGGFHIKDHKGEEVAKYIRALAEPDICMTDLQIVVIVPASNGKIGEIKLKEIQAGI